MLKIYRRVKILCMKYSENKEKNHKKTKKIDILISVTAKLLKSRDEQPFESVWELVPSNVVFIPNGSLFFALVKMGQPGI